MRRTQRGVQPLCSRRLAGPLADARCANPDAAPPWKLIWLTAALWKGRARRAVAAAAALPRGVVQALSDAALAKLMNIQQQWGQGTLSQSGWRCRNSADLLIKPPTESMGR